MGHVPRGLATRPRIGDLRMGMCAGTKRHHAIGLNRELELQLQAFCTWRGVGPDAHFLLAALAIGDDAATEWFSTCRRDLVFVEQRLLGLRGLHVVDRHGQTAL